MALGGDAREGGEAPPLAEPQSEQAASETPSSSLSREEPDAGSSLGPPSLDITGAAEPPAAVVCPGPAPPLDVVMIVDNSGSMVTTTTEAERAIPQFALGLERGAVDYRIILISRHRITLRTATEEASTSVCVSLPLSGLPQCPAPRPALTSRFFQYSTKIDASDSFERVLEAAAAPDPFDLTSDGWVEWLRSDARVEFIEVSDANSDVSIEAFIEGLAALAPEHFNADPLDPGFVFHSITGVAERAVEGDVYEPDEPLQPQACTRTEGDVDNAGEVYQALSRATGGLRQPVCPASALGSRLDVIAADMIARNARACASN